MWLVSSTMTVTGESDKEIKSMAFTPCSFLLLFRKYFFMTTSVNGKLNWFDIKNVYGEYTAVGSNNSAEICRLSLTPGTWLLLGYIDNSMSKDTIYNNSIFRESLSHHCQTVRSTLIGGGGSVNSYAITVQTNMDMLLGTYDNSDIKGNIFRGTLLAIRLLKI